MTIQVLGMQYGVRCDGLNDAVRPAGAVAYKRKTLCRVCKSTSS